MNANARKARKRRLTQQPWFAAVMLGAGVLVAYGSFRAPATTELSSAADQQQFMMEELAADVAPGEDQESQAVSRDLVAEFGSYDGTTPVAEFLAALPTNGSHETPPAAPAGEVAVGAWRGDAPPQLAIGVIFVGDGSRRAVVDGKVVGIGDKLGEARIERIERKGLLVEWRGRLLTYDFETTCPREYRAEAAKRKDPNNESQGNK